jgi:hypothetical protein
MRTATLRANAALRMKAAVDKLAKQTSASDAEALEEIQKAYDSVLKLVSPDINKRVRNA